MNKRMLVDATHPEEIRVAIVQDQRLIDLDIETSTKEQIKGNIYLARVTRVEPALQAAFVDFNGGRQGFLSVNDIHPKYYPAPEEKEKDKEKEPDPPEEAHEEEEAEDDEEITAEVPLKATRPQRRRNIPIQKILSRGQTLLVQVVKEARGNKGASLTTNLSLAGRYTVLLPDNSGAGGGISRKIVDAQERKNLKELMSSLEIPQDVSLIIRTAGLGRTKREITRDMNYLLRLWKKIQDATKSAQPPASIHEEADLILRTIRDLYTTDMTEILIHGAEAYRRGKDYMRLLMPRYVKVVQPYKEKRPLFSQFGVENQIESMHERVISLKSGGYLVIEPTEALVTIDINSGRATREKDVESTAFKTNLLAAEEIARQLRLRDLGGLVVIDFIDMEEKKHNAEVEKKVKEAFKLDRAKIQIGRISQFGLLELSRQRLKPAFAESNRNVCPRCQGLGTIRSIESAAIQLMRRIGDEASEGNFEKLTYRVSPEVSNYIFNNKRMQVAQLEETHELVIEILADPDLQTPDLHREAKQVGRADGDDKQEKKGKREKRERKDRKGMEERSAKSAEESTEKTEAPQEPVEETSENGQPEKKRRRRRRRKKSAASSDGANAENVSQETEPTSAKETSAAEEGAMATEVPGIFVLAPEGGTSPTSSGDSQADEAQAAGDSAGTDGEGDEEAPAKPKRRRRRRRSSRSKSAAADNGDNTEDDADAVDGKTPDADGETPEAKAPATVASGQESPPPEAGSPEESLPTSAPAEDSSENVASSEDAPEPVPASSEASQASVEELQAEAPQASDLTPVSEQSTPASEAVENEDRVALNDGPESQAEADDGAEPQAETEETDDSSRGGAEQDPPATETIPEPSQTAATEPVPAPVAELPAETTLDTTPPPVALVETALPEDEDEPDFSADTPPEEAASEPEEPTLSVEETGEPKERA